MKKYIVVVAMLLTSAVLGQEYKVAKSSGSLVIREVNKVQIEGYSGSEIIFTSLDRSRDRDDRAKGLKAINSMGLEDNSGLGLSVVQNGDAVEVRQLKKMDGPKIKIQVPKGVKIVYDHSSPYGSDLKLKNIENEVEISTVHNGVYLDNVTGPINVKTVHGEVEASFTAAMKHPVSIKSTHGPVDITIPVAAKATLNMSTKYGEILVDPALNVEVQNRGDWKVYGANDIEGKINGVRRS
jgi:predicted membrane protein